MNILNSNYDKIFNHKITISCQMDFLIWFAVNNNKQLTLTFSQNVYIRVFCAWYDFQNV